MREKLYLFLFFTAITTLSIAQVNPSGTVAASYQQSWGTSNEHPEIQCAHTRIHQRLMTTDAAYAAEQEQREESLALLVKNYASSAVAKTEEILTVPVVVHIMHDGDAYGTGSNITDEQVYSAINALNQDYRRMAGTNGEGDGVDIGIEFCLAQRSPTGQAHSGINRVNACSVPLYCSEGITAGEGQGADESDVKDLSRWPNQQYYNIWVVTEIENNDGGSGIQGYAYFPTTSSVDGTVVLYNAFGTTGALKTYTNMNRTLTHELGHAFALFHTFQGGTCSESNCALQGDRVCDTPPTTLNSSCNSPACSALSRWRITWITPAKPARTCLRLAKRTACASPCKIAAATCSTPTAVSR